MIQDASSAGVNASQAETTIGNFKKQPPICFGCDGPHSWSTRQTDNKSYVVTCPNKDKSGVKAKAEAKIADMRSRRKSRRDRDDKDKRKKTKVTTNVTDASSSTVVVTSPNGRVVFVAQVMVNAHEMRQPMPVQITNNMPHIFLGLGPSAETPNCPDIRCAIDTCAGLNTGSYTYLMALATKYPHCLYRLYTSQEFAPIVLSGIVTEGDNALTTSLDCTFQFFLPYTLRGDGAGCMISIAAGTGVAVNVILGIPFILAMKMHIDFVDSVATCNAIDHPPFPIEMCRTSNTVPTEVQVNAVVPVNDTLAQLRHYDQWRSAQVARMNPSVRREAPILRPPALVRFGPGSDVSAPTASASSSATSASATNPNHSVPSDSTLSNSQMLSHYNEQQLNEFM